MAHPTLLDIRQRVLSILGKDADSTVGALTPGDNSGTDAITSANQITGYALDIARFFCRAAYPIDGSASGTLAAGQSAATVRLDLLATVSVGGATIAGAVLWAATAVSVGGSYLERIGQNVLDVAYPPGTAASMPTYWAPRGDGTTIRFAPPLSGSSAALAVDGYVLPPRLASDGADWSAFLPDDLVMEIIPYGVCWMLGLQNYDDGPVVARMPAFAAVVNGAILEYWGRLDENVRTDYLIGDGQSGPAFLAMMAGSGKKR